MSNEHPVYWYVMYIIEVFIFASTLTCPWFSSGDKKRRDVVQCIVHVPKYDFYIIASQKGIICQWSSKVYFSISLLFLCVSYDTFPVTCESWLHQEYITVLNFKFPGTCNNFIRQQIIDHLWIFWSYCPYVSCLGSQGLFSFQTLLKHSPKEKSSCCWQFWWLTATFIKTKNVTGVSSPE